MRRTHTRLRRLQGNVHTVIVRSHVVLLGNLFVLALLMDGSQSEITGRAVIDCIRRVWLLLRIVKKIWTIELGLLKKRLTILGIIFGLK